LLDKNGPLRGAISDPGDVSALPVIVMMAIMMVVIVPVMMRSDLDHNLGLYRGANCKKESEQQTQREDPAREAFQYFSPVCKAHSSCTSGDTILSSLISLYSVRASID
jgi:hypothetical protein